MIKIPCEFVLLRTGRTICKTHRQSLLYIVHGRIICQVAEDELISKFGDIDKYLKEMKVKGVERLDFDDEMYSL